MARSSSPNESKSPLNVRSIQVQTCRRLDSVENTSTNLIAPLAIKGTSSSMTMARSARNRKNSARPTRAIVCCTDSAGVARRMPPAASVSRRNRSASSHWLWGSDWRGLEDSNPTTAPLRSPRSMAALAPLPLDNAIGGMPAKIPTGYTSIRPGRTTARNRPSERQASTRINSPSRGGACPGSPKRSRRTT